MAGQKLHKGETTWKKQIKKKTVYFPGIYSLSFYKLDI